MGTAITNLMLERCAQTIEQVITPNLTGAFEFENAMWLGIILHILAPMVEEKSQELSEENDAMRQVLGQVLEVLWGQKALAQNSVRNDLIVTLERELKKVDDGPPDVSEENYSLKGALVDVIKGLDALTDDLPQETMSALKQQVHSALRQQLDHSVAHVISRMGGVVL